MKHPEIISQAFLLLYFSLVAVERTSGQPPQTRVTVELPASEDPTPWDRKGAEELVKALQQTGQFDVATVVSTSDSAFAGLPPLEYPGRVLVLAATQGRLLPADDTAAEIVAAELLKRGYHLVERQSLNAVLREQGLQQSGAADQVTAAHIGKLAGADTVVIADVHHGSIIRREEAVSLALKQGSEEWGSGDELIEERRRKEQEEFRRQEMLRQEEMLRKLTRKQRQQDSDSGDTACLPEEHGSSRLRTLSLRDRFTSGSGH